MGKIPFIKAHGTGNDFIVFIEEDCPEVVRERLFISRICRHRTGVGADAVLVLSKDADGYDFKMDYYNSDGSWETMCANGARCAALVMQRKGKADKKIRMLAGDGPHEMEIVSPGTVRLKMKPPVYKSDTLEVEGFSGCHVDSGAAHFVTEVLRFTMNKAEISAPPIRYADEFSPRGINVNFYEILDHFTLKVITYEKGIERVMLSCGSGSVAAAFHAAKKHQLKSPLRVIVPGGKLTVEFDDDWKDVWLKGPAVILFESEIDPSDLE